MKGLRRTTEVAMLLFARTMFLSALGAAAFGQSNPLPLISQPLVPDAVVPGSPSFTLTVNGAGFVSGSVANWNGAALATMFVRDSQLTATVPASNIATAGTASVTVLTPPPGGGTSNFALLQIAQPTSLVSLSRTDSPTEQSPTWTTAGDFNNDGKPDLAVTHSGGESVSVFLGNGDGSA